MTLTESTEQAIHNAEFDEQTTGPEDVQRRQNCSVRSGKEATSSEEIKVLNKCQVGE